MNTAQSASPIDVTKLVIVSRDRAVNQYRLRNKKGLPENRDRVVLYNCVVQETSGAEYDYERGFGCGIGLVGCVAEDPSEEDTKKLESVYWDGHAFRFDAGKDRLVTTRLIVLERTGEIKAIRPTLPS